ncbi:SDR family oxidoreductase [Silvimonas iriomotensis]|uniref:NAD(P)-dependent oxidoreductase n=1 Tax=Silvimonas iriomotensis TaxID=449662 RepID=A0ABQ2PCY5_9NEIS|nr:SDR family oxidoreductase [Silvimonas iriomotensis]GGP23010.1 NAD(P)-dependent oxidoreductase [Silvimonas iriomotensis]
MFVVTGTTGQLGRLVIASLLKHVPASQIIAAVRQPERAADLAAQGIQVRQADYSDPASLDAAFAGATRLLLISSSEVGQRVAQHQNVIDAAKRAGVALLAYTSLLHLDTSPLFLAGEHRETEAYLKASGVPYVMLRNGWYTENYLASIPVALQHGAYIGSAGEGKIASAARADYAEAAAIVLTLEDQSGKVYELAGDTAYTLTDFAAALSSQAGKEIPYVNLPEAEFRAALLEGGLPEGLAFVLADSDAGAAKGALFDDQHQLSSLIGHQTAVLAAMISNALK